MRIPTNAFFWGVPEWLKIAYSGTCLDVTHFPEIFKSSNLILRHPNTSTDAVEGLKEARRNKNATIHSQDVPETKILAQNHVFG